MEGGRKGMDGAGFVEERRGRWTGGRGRQDGKETGEAAAEGRWGGGRVLSREWMVGWYLFGVHIISTVSIRWTVKNDWSM
jgi:hypothetical protein